jgi:hypothetical protein
LLWRLICLSFIWTSSISATAELLAELLVVLEVLRDVVEPSADVGREDPDVLMLGCSIDSPILTQKYLYRK